MSTTNRRPAWYFSGYPASVRNLDLALDHIGNLTAEAIAIDREIGNAYGDLGFDLTRDLDIDRALGRVRELAANLDINLARGYAPAHTYARACELTSAFDRCLHLIGDNDNELARSVCAARVVAADLTNELARTAQVRGQRSTGHVASSAIGVLTAAVRLLPAADRARYAEEYRSELWELAQAGTGRIRQMGYALRQLRTALPTSSALRFQCRRSAAP